MNEMKDSKETNCWINVQLSKTKSTGQVNGDVEAGGLFNHNRGTKWQSLEQLCHTATAACLQISDT